MPRGLTGSQLTELAKRVKRPAYFMELALASATIRAWNGRGTVNTLTFNWLGVGDFGIIEGIGSNLGLRANSITVALVGLPGDLITGSMLKEAREERYQGRPLKIYMGFTDLATDVLLHTPTLIWSGVADTLSYRVGESVTVQLSGEHFSSHLRRANGLRATSESHNARLGNPSPRDLFFEAQDRLMGKPRPLLDG